MAENLSIEADDCVTLTPDSPRYKAVVQQYRPQTIAEVRKLLGPSPRDANTPAQHCCLPADLAANLPDPEELSSKDPELRMRARLQAVAAASAYVRAADTKEFKHLEPLLDRYIALTKPVLFAFLFADIDIANGATLTVAHNAHILTAGNIRMHGTGRMVCKGPTTIRATSVNGRIRPLVVSSAIAGTIASAMRNS